MPKKNSPKSPSKVSTRQSTPAAVAKLSTPSVDHMELLTAYLTSTVTTHLGNLAVHLQELINSIDALVENPTQFLEQQVKPAKAARVQAPVEEDDEEDEESEEDELVETVDEDDEDEEDDEEEDEEETVDEEDDESDWDDEDVEEEEPVRPARRATTAGRPRR